MNVNAAAPPWDGLIQTVATELNKAAYPVALRHGTAESGVSLELELREVLYETLLRIVQDLLRAPGEAQPLRDGQPTEPELAGAVLERLVTYYGLDENGEPTSRRLLSYKIIASPGPREDSGLASIVTLALSDPREDCNYCEKFHTVEKGGAAAALAAAIRYLDAHHRGDRLRKIESDVRG